MTLSHFFPRNGAAGKQVSFLMSISWCPGTQRNRSPNIRLQYIGSPLCDHLVSGPLKIPHDFEGSFPMLHAWVTLVST